MAAGDQPARGWRYIDLAALGVNTGRSYAAGLARIILYPLAAAAVLGAAVAFLAATGWNPSASGDRIELLIAQYGVIAVAGMAVVHAVVRSHRRPWRSLIAPDLRIDLRRFAIGVGVQVVILAGELALLAALTGLPLGLSWDVSLRPAALPVFALALLLVPLQSASEEILFRGYLTQALGRLVRSRVLIALIVALSFGALHLNTHGPWTVPYYAVFALVLSVVSLRDERLELAIGGHTGTNLFGWGIGNLVGSAAVFGDGGALPFSAASVAVVAVNGALFYGLTRLLLRVFCRPRPPI